MYGFFCVIKNNMSQALYSKGPIWFCLCYYWWVLHSIPISTGTHTQVGTGKRKDKLCTLYHPLLVQPDFKDNSGFKLNVIMLVHKVLN